MPDRRLDKKVTRGTCFGDNPSRRALNQWKYGAKTTSYMFLSTSRLGCSRRPRWRSAVRRTARAAGLRAASQGVRWCSWGTACAIALCVVPRSRAHQRWQGRSLCDVSGAAIAGPSQRWCRGRSWRADTSPQERSHSRSTSTGSSCSRPTRSRNASAFGGAARVRCARCGAGCAPSRAASSSEGHAARRAGGRCANVPHASR